MAGFRRRVGAALGLVVGLSLSASAYAWKPITHAYLAQQAVKDLLDDEYITLDEVDPKVDPQDRTKNALKGILSNSKGPSGNVRFRSSPAIRDLIRRCGAQYYTGLMGPDALPDLLTGQNIIHPPGGPDPKDGTETNVDGPGTAYWWDRMWTQTAKGAPFDTGCNRAFVLGMFAHGAGDMFAHTFVNGHTGNIFQLSINGLRHILMEGYFFQRTPSLEPHEGKNVYELAAQGMNEELTKFNRFVLDPYPLGEAAGHDKRKSIFYQFGRLRTWVKEHRRQLHELQRRWHNEYQVAEARFSDEYDRCGILHPKSCTRAATLGRDAGKALALHKLGGGIIRNVILPYMDDWAADIDEGLLEWVRVSHRVGVRLMFSDPSKESPDSTLSYVVSQLRDYFLAHVIRMIGLPDWLSDAAVYISEMVKGIEKIIAEVTAPLKSVKESISKDIKAFAKYVLKEAFGIDVDELKDYWFNPAAYIDVAFRKFSSPISNLSGQEQRDPDGRPVTVASLNRWMGLQSTDHTGKEKFDWRKFPPAFNTVQMIKLTFLDLTAIDQLLRTLGSDQKWPTSGDSNVMLGGWQGAMDAGNQWANGPRLIFARECRVFNRLFMKHTGPTLDKPYQPRNECAKSDSWVKDGIPKSADPFRVVGDAYVDLEEGETHRFEFTGDFKTFSVKAHGRASEFWQKQGNAINYNAPTGLFSRTTQSDLSNAWAIQEDVQFTVTDDDFEQAIVSVRIAPKPVLLPFVEGALAGSSIKFYVPSAERTIAWKVTKGRGKFGDASKLTELRHTISSLEQRICALPEASPKVPNPGSFKAIEEYRAQLRKEKETLSERRALVVELADARREVLAEEGTFYAPTDVKEDAEEDVEVIAEIAATKNRPALTLRQKFPLYAKMPRTLEELHRMFESNEELQAALRHADVIEKARASGKFKLLALNGGIMQQLKFSLDGVKISSEGAFKRKLDVPQTSPLMVRQGAKLPELKKGTTIPNVKQDAALPGRGTSPPPNGGPTPRRP